MNKQQIRILESSACARIVGIGGGSVTRNLVAQTLKAWRAVGEYDRAVWFRRHAFYISGHLYKDGNATLRSDCPSLSCKA